MELCSLSVSVTPVLFQVNLGYKCIDMASNNFSTSFVVYVCPQLTRRCSVALAISGNCTVFQFSKKRCGPLLIHTAMKVALRLIVCYVKGINHSGLSIKRGSIVIYTNMRLDLQKEIYFSDLDHCWFIIGMVRRKAQK